MKKTSYFEGTCKVKSFFLLIRFMYYFINMSILIAKTIISDGQAVVLPKLSTPSSYQASADNDEKDNTKPNHTSTDYTHFLKKLWVDT